MKIEHQKLALNTFEKLMNECESESEISDISTFLATVCIKVIHGIEGQEFKKDFLNSAITDGEMIKPVQVQVQ